MAAPIDLDVPPAPECHPYRETGFKLAGQRKTAMFVARHGVIAPLAAGISPLAREDGYMPIKLKFAQKDHGRKDHRRRWLRPALRGFAVLLLVALSFPAALARAQARARENLAIPASFEVGESPSGNYLAA